MRLFATVRTGFDKHQSFVINMIVSIDHQRLLHDHSSAMQKTHRRSFSENKHCF